MDNIEVANFVNRFNSEAIFKPFVGDDGIYVQTDDPRYGKMLISRELFVEAYNKWILGNYADVIGLDFLDEDTADDWSE